MKFEDFQNMCREKFPVKMEQYFYGKLMDYQPTVSRHMVGFMLPATDDELDVPLLLQELVALLPPVSIFVGDDEGKSTVELAGYVPNSINGWYEHHIFLLMLVIPLVPNI